MINSATATAIKTNIKDTPAFSNLVPKRIGLITLVIHKNTPIATSQADLARELK